MSATSKSLSGLRVLLADDHTLVRAGIRCLVEKIPGVQVVGEAGDGREVLDLVQARKANLVLMDIAMPNLNGLEATARIAASMPMVRVIILSMHENEEYYWQALRAGAAGYLLKKAAVAELETALYRVAGGELFLSNGVSARLLKKFPLHRLPENSLEQLTGRQREILQLIAEGQTTKAIALTLRVSPKTVEYHRAQMMTQLGIFDIPGLVRFALQAGLVAQ